MKPRGKRTPKTCDPFLKVPQVESEETAHNKNKEASNLLAGEGVQCEMGTEVFRQYWTPPSQGMEENDSDQVITGDPIGTNPLGYVNEEDDHSSASRIGSTTIDPGAKVNACSNYVFSSQDVNMEKGPDVATATCKESPSLVLTNDGAETMRFPLVLNVVDESGTKEVVAVVSLDAMPTSNNSINSTAHVEAVSRNTGENVVQHVIKPGKSFTCGDCGQVFSSVVLYGKHCLDHNSSEPFKCTRCTRRFKRRQDLVRHTKCHPEEAFSCGTCFAKFSDREEFMSHSKIHEHVPNSPKPCVEIDAPEMLCKVEAFPCSQCDKTFSDADLLQHHEFTHNEGELYPCDQCGRTFREESRLGMHLKLHKKNQRCDKCDEVFTNMFDFNEHMIAHKYEYSKEEFKCVHCKVTFNSFYFLKKHVLSHGMEVHWCGDCGGSGHVDSSHSHHNSEDTNMCEKPVIMMVKSDNVPKHEEDPLKLEDSSLEDLVDARLEEEMVDDVIIKSERGTSSEEEAEVQQIIDVQGKKSKGKRKYSGTKGKPLQGICPEPRKKSARNN